MNITPLQDRIVVRRRDEENTSQGGIVIPPQAKEKPSRGKVEAVGPGIIENNKVRSVGVKVGDEVLFGKYSGTEVTLSGEEYIIMREDDVMAIINEAGA